MRQWCLPFLTILMPMACVLGSTRAAMAQTPAFRHVFVIVLENQEYEGVIGNAAAPYMNALANQNGLATSAFAVTHPSLPNYMALTSGATAFTTDCTGCLVASSNLADQIEATGKSWTGYMEDMPTPCTTTDAGLYAAKHNPFVHYADIVTNAARCTSHVVSFDGFASDLASNRLADFVWITPNLCHDMHDCSVASGDAWLSSIVPQILEAPAFADSALFVLFDEGTTNAGGGGHIPLIVASRWTAPGTRLTTTTTLYSVLRTIEDAWGLAPLGNAAGATAMTGFFPTASSLPAEQVIYASDVTHLAGSWIKTPDSTAAGGLKLATKDNGAPTVDLPQAQPANYFDATFEAPAQTRFRVWLRLHAANDSKWNDSVFVQFSDSVDAQGRAAYRIGTTGGYTVNLWECATCQSFGWGWQRHAYWLADTGDVQFPTGGAHTIRVQPREDGVEVDQIVISPAEFITAAPGPVSGDSTIVPKPGADSPGSGGDSAPFGAAPFSIPGSWRASDFDNGGEGIAYHDNSAGNAGGAYRQTDVDLEASSDGGFDVGWIGAGEWLNYTVNVSAAGTYSFSVRVASPGPGGTLHLEMAGVNVSSAIKIPATGGWQTWQTVTTTVNLPAGIHVARLVMDTVGPGGAVGNLNAIRFVASP